MIPLQEFANASSELTVLSEVGPHTRAQDVFYNINSDMVQPLTHGTHVGTEP